ncbi:MAG: hypothetical protein PVJ57_17725 [Phycisphaerae bacterium]|jgi:hypothetical protein
MAQASIITLANAITVDLNGGTFEGRFVAQRGYRPVVELPDITGAIVTVVPASLKGEVADRRSWFYDDRIYIGLLKKVDPEDLAELDGLMALVEEIGDHLIGSELAAFPEARCLAIENDPLFSPEHLEQRRQFTSLLTAVYRLRRVS